MRRRRSLGGGFSPRKLFTSGAKGVWYDPSDFSTLFQDSAGTTPVTAIGQSVGKILDKSGNEFHGTQATLASQATLQQTASGFYYLSLDGSNDSMATASIDFSGTNKISVCAGVTKNSDTAIGMLAELSATSDTNNGAFYIVFPVSSTDLDIRFNVRGTANNQRDYGPYAAPTTRVFSAAFSTTAATSALAISARINGVAQTGANTVTASSTGNFGNYPLYIGRRANATLPFNGRIYQMVVCGKELSASELASTEAYVNSKTGAY